MANMASSLELTLDVQSWDITDRPTGDKNPGDSMDTEQVLYEGSPAPQSDDGMYFTALTEAFY